MTVPRAKTLEELFKFRLAQLRADSEYATASITQIVRVVSYGLIALLLPFVTSPEGKLPQLLVDHPLWVLFAAMLGAVSVALDYAQNVFADRVARAALADMVVALDRNNLEISSPEIIMARAKKSRDQELRSQCYVAKSLFAGAGLFIIIVTIFAQMSR